MFQRSSSSRKSTHMWCASPERGLFSSARQACVTGQSTGAARLFQGTTRKAERRIGFCIHVSVSWEEECSQGLKPCSRSPHPCSPLYLSSPGFWQHIVNHFPAKGMRWILTKCGAPQGGSCVALKEPMDLGGKKGRFVVCSPQLGTLVLPVLLRGSPGCGLPLKVGSI